LKIIKHEQYYGGALYNDVALIIVTQPFLLRENVGTLCLPSQNYVFSKERCHASGWGKNIFGKHDKIQFFDFTKSNIFTVIVTIIINKCLIIQHNIVQKYCNICEKCLR